MSSNASDEISLEKENREDALGCRQDPLALVAAGPVIAVRPVRR